MSTESCPFYLGLSALSQDGSLSSFTYLVMQLLYFPLYNRQESVVLYAHLLNLHPNPVKSTKHYSNFMLSHIVSLSWGLQVNINECTEIAL